MTNFKVCGRINAPASRFVGTGIELDESLEFEFALFLITRFQLRKDAIFDSRFSVDTSD